MKKNLIIGSILLAASVGANADYQLEANAGLGFGSGDQNTADASLSIYFETIDVTNGPLREAAFLNKASSVTISGFSDTPNRNGFETFGASALGHLVLEGDAILEIGAGREDGGNFTTLGGGAYINDNTNVVVSYIRGTTFGTHDLVADLHGYLALEGEKSLAYDIRLGTASLEGETQGKVYGGNVSIYLNKKLSFSMGYEEKSFAALDISTASLQAEYFFTEGLATSLTYNSTSFDDENSELLSLNATARF